MKKRAIIVYCFLFLFLTLNQQASAATDQLSLDGIWRIATDAENQGREKLWFDAMPDETFEAKVPWILQGTFPDYNGLVWYWHEFDVPSRFYQNGRFLLHFEQVDYYGEFWLNGKLIGKHEGGETPFSFDVTEAIDLNGKNFLAVRVLNPTHEMIDNITFNQTPRRCKKLPFVSGGTYNHGGITGPVRLEAVPLVYVEDIYIDGRMDGSVQTEVTVRNTMSDAQNANIEWTFSDGRNGDTIKSIAETLEIPVGVTTFAFKTKLENPRLWNLNSPALYRGTARLSISESDNFSEKSSRFGFRDFRFENGYFRLNGKRIYVKSTHTVNNYPIGLQFPHDPDLWRRDLLNLKAMGFNMIRFIWGGAFPEQLDYCDEIGLMVYDESYASHDIQNSPYIDKRWHDGLFNLIKRDRNHPSVVIWGLLNEIPSSSPIIGFAARSLPKIRQLDSSRMVMFNSGRWDNWSSSSLDGRLKIICSAVTTEPWVGINPTLEQIETLGIKWPAGKVAAHPGPKNEFSVLRWIAPTSGKANIKVLFESFAEKATTDVHIFVNGKSIFDSFLNLNGKENFASYSESIAVQQGETIDIVVGAGNENYGADTTGVEATIELNGTVYIPNDSLLSAKPNNETNIDAIWQFGFLPYSERPELDQWTLLTEQKADSWKETIGTLANPDSSVWEDLVQDTHPYQRVPHTAKIIQFLRTTKGYAPESGQPLYLSEYGIGSAIDVIKTVRFFEMLHCENLCDAQYYRGLLDQYLVDWDKWKLSEAFHRPDDFFAQSIAKMASQRTIGLNAIRSNPDIVGHNVTGGIDHVLTGEGLTTPFREMKPGTMDALFDAWSPLRWSIFAEPVHFYRGNKLTIEAALTNEDVLSPGKYAARAEIFDENDKKCYEKEFNVTIPDSGDREPPFAQLCFSETFVFDFPTGKYRFATTFNEGAAAAGGEVFFYVTDKADMPSVDTEVKLWNEDPAFLDWLNANRIAASSYTADSVKENDTILVTGKESSAGLDAAQLDKAVRSGATIIFLCPAIFEGQNNQISTLFLNDKGRFDSVWSWLYQKDEWSKKHPFFNGLPSGGLMDNQYYRELISDIWFHDTVAPSEAVAGAIKASQDYSSGLTLAVYPHGKGTVIFNSFFIRENLETNPAAERLLRNIILNISKESE